MVHPGFPAPFSVDVRSSRLLGSVVTSVEPVVEDAVKAARGSCEASATALGLDVTCCRAQATWRWLCICSGRDDYGSPAGRRCVPAGTDAARRRPCGWWSYFDDLMRGPSGLTKTQREMIAVVVRRGPLPLLNAGPRRRVAAANEGPHPRRSPAVELPLRRPRSARPHDARLRGQGHEAPDRCGEAEVNRLREAGYTDEDILHIAELTAIFNFNGRIANALGLMPNPEYHALGRNPDPPQ